MRWRSIRRRTSSPTRRPRPRRRPAIWRSAPCTLPRAVTADGKPLPAGTYQVKLTAQEAKPDAVGTSENARALGRVRPGRHGQGTRGRQHRPAGRDQDRREGHAAGGRRLEGPDPAGQRIRARLDQQGRQPLPDSPAGRGRRNAWAVIQDTWQMVKWRLSGSVEPASAICRLPSATLLRSPSRRTARDAGARPA